jgi:MFS transporter, UMF1 family
VGPRRAIIIELVLLCIAVTLALSVTQTSILYGLVRVEGVLHGGPFFNTLADVFYLCVIALVSIGAVSAISSSRALLVAIAPRERISEFFGLYMISATATVWLGPLLTNIATEASGDQRIGFSPVLGLLLLGLVLMRSSGGSYCRSPLPATALEFAELITSSKWSATSPTVGVDRHLSTHE